MKNGRSMFNSCMGFSCVGRTDSPLDRSALKLSCIRASSFAGKPRRGRKLATFNTNP